MKKAFLLFQCMLLSLGCAVAENIDPGIQRGDVLMRSLRAWPDPDIEGDERNTLETAKAFKVDKILWIYENTKQYNQKVRAEGIGIGTTMAANAREAWHPKMNQQQRRQFADNYTIRNLKGEQVLMRHFKHFGEDAFIMHFQPDICIDQWADIYTNYVSDLYRMGIESIHRDDPAANWAALRCGGTFTDAAVEYFREYLKENYPTSELKKLGVENIRTFNVRAHLLDLGAPTDDALWQWKGSPLMPIYSDAMLKATVEFYQEVRDRVEKKTGMSIPWSRNGVGPLSGLDTVFDFRIGEYQRHHSQPQTLLEMSRFCADNGKLQGTISMVDGKWNEHPEEYVRETRKHIPTAYATGMIPLVPWCMYMHQAPRYYGTVEDFGDLYHFVSDHRELFDGHKLAAANGIDTQANLYSWLPNKELNYPQDSDRNLFWIDKENIFAFLRENEGTGSKVIHLVDWNTSPRPFAFSFTPSDLLGVHSADLTILRHGKKDIHINGYSGGTIEVPAITPWALITVEPGQIQPKVGIAPRIVSPGKRLVPVGTEVVLESVALYDIFWRFDNMDFQKYDRFSKPVITKSGTLETYTLSRFDGKKSDVVRIAYEAYQDYTAAPGVIEAASPAARLEQSFNLVKGEMKVNRSFVADELSMGSKKVEHGISTQGHTLVTCKVNPSWQYFSVRVGVDDHEDRRPCARFQVWFDSDVAYETPVLNPSKLIIADEEREIFYIALKIPKGISQIRLVSVPSGFFKEQNNIVWADPTAYE